MVGWVLLLGLAVCGSGMLVGMVGTLSGLKGVGTADGSLTIGDSIGKWFGSAIVGMINCDVGITAIATTTGVACATGWSMGAWTVSACAGAAWVTVSCSTVGVGVTTNPISGSAILVLVGVGTSMLFGTRSNWIVPKAMVWGN